MPKTMSIAMTAAIVVAALAGGTASAFARNDGDYYQGAFPTNQTYNDVGEFQQGRLRTHQPGQSMTTGSTSNTTNAPMMHHRSVRKPTR
ncbi:hypothetical protein [Rhizobium sp. BK251]|uniref:hypothetical protein n=1 Tax=Rhizobium sp. BK251 TaxID=2512125 RepID=UPI0010466FC1|nr:hypothetical protein [Rhizobium sp. BK251]TCL76232.1 hypothetical protein EV286_101780 [Rhizobium sp. BK251]